MPYHDDRRTEFLNRATADPTTILGNAAAYAVGLQRATVAAGQVGWRVLGVHHLSPAENRGGHHIYVDVVDEQGQRLRDPSLRLRWGWEGQRADEAAPPRAFDKGDNEPATNVDVNSGQIVWVEVEGQGLASDRVHNMHTKHADEPGPGGETWNSIGHHSFYILFQRVAEGARPVDPPTKPEEPTEPEKPVDPPPASDFRFEAWPTEGRIVTQEFGENPADYAEFGLPGHEGIDIAADSGSRIFCVAPGQVKFVQPDPTLHPYGIHVRVSHRDGYETIYAHLLTASVQHGQRVGAGHVLGLADNTGNSRGDHLHLTLKNHSRQGAPGYPGNIIDPMPFLQPLLNAKPTPASDAAAYVRDSVPDGSEFAPNHSFEQQWVVRNVGQTTWGEGYTLAFQSGDPLGAPASVAVPATVPGAEAMIGVTFRTPVQLGNKRSVWQLRNAAGQWFGDRMWVDVNINTVGQPQPAAVGNKLGFYLHTSTDQHGLWQSIQRLQPPVILIHADTANKMLLQEIRRFRAPDSFVVCRLYKENNTQRQMIDNADPGAHGRAMADEILNYDFGLATQRGENGRLLIDGWMSLNEAIPGPGSGQFQEQPAETARLLHNYDLFQVAFQRRLQEAGVEAVAFNFAAGNFGTAAHYLDHFPQTLESHTYLGFHEYGWPTLSPAAGSATSGGTYRQCLEGIRARYGPRHRVIMTEAGLTRMYQNASWGDKGWLNTDAPQSEEAYWASLDWYNQQMLQDEYVLGACLYEVGHHGQWESFRHLGQDNESRPITIVDRMVALRQAALPSASPQPLSIPAQPPIKPVDIAGTVTLAGFGIADASVRLLGGQETVATMPGAMLDMPEAVTWSRKVDGLDGTLWNLWLREVAHQVAGISWQHFKHEFGVHNPMQSAEEPLQANSSYWMPENRDVVLDIAWDRPLTDYAGTVWHCWQRFVQNRVVGLGYHDFKRRVVQENPALSKDGRFAVDQTYNLPRNSGHKRYALQAFTGRRGGFRFKGMPAGAYGLLVSAPDTQPFRTTFSTQFSSQFRSHDELTLDVQLVPNVPLMPAGQGPDGALTQPSNPLPLTIGATVFAQTTLNVRKSPGYVGKATDDIQGQMKPGTAATIVGNAITAADLVWWPIRTTVVVTDGDPAQEHSLDIDGWAAQSIPGQILLNTSRPL